MKKLLALILALSMLAALAACSNTGPSGSTAPSADPSQQVSASGGEGGTQSDTPTEVTITSLNGSGEAVELTVPYDPQRVAILDMASLDILDALGVGSRVVGTADTSLDYLQDYISDDIANLGTIKEADLEAVMACEPDVIFIGGRLAGSYDALSQIAPVVYLSTDTELGVVESVRKNAATIATMFGLESEVEELMAGFGGQGLAFDTIAASRPWQRTPPATPPSWAWSPAAASTCWATTAAAP